LGSASLCCGRWARLMALSAAWAATGTGPCLGCTAAHASLEARRSCARLGRIAVAPARRRLRSAGWRVTTSRRCQAARRDSRARADAGRWHSTGGVGGGVAGAGCVGGAGVPWGVVARSASSATSEEEAACRRTCDEWEIHGRRCSCCPRPRPWRQGAFSRRRHLHGSGGGRLSALAQLRQVSGKAVS
jgi:hypothetical protein